MTKKIPNKFWSKIFILGFVSLVFFGSIYNVSASANGIELSPAFIRSEINVGGEESLSINIKNDSPANAKFKVSFKSISPENFIKKDNLDFDLADATPTNPASWLNSKSQEVEIPTNSNSDFNFQINIPNDITSGSYYPVLFLEDISGVGEKNIGISNNAFVVIYLNVINSNTQVSQDDEMLKNFSATKNITFDSSNSFRTIFENNSNYYIQPRGKITVYDPNGVRISSISTINDDYKIYVQGEILDQTVEWEMKNKWLYPIGKYRAVLEVYENADQSKSDTAEVSFYLIHYNYIVGFVVVLALILAVIILAKRKRHPKANLQ